MSLEDVAAGAEAVDSVIAAELGRVFAQRRSVEVAVAYMAALAPGVRANCWALAEAAGHAGWSRMQALLNQYVWDYTELRSCLAPVAARYLRCEDDDLIGPGLAVDETAALKKGDATFAVSPQHAGCTGKVENCVTTVFTAYVTTRGSCWVDFDVYMPKRWAQDPARRAAAGVPEDLTLITKPDLAAAQIQRLVATGVPIGWVAADEVYGRSTHLRAVCEELGLAYVFIVPSDFHVTTGAGATWTAAEAAAHAVYERRSCGTGSQGPRLFDWAMIATGSPNRFLLIRRLISRPDQLGFFICWVPATATATLTYLITIAGRRWPVEVTFKTGKDVLGWDQSQARTYKAVNRHTALTAVAQLRDVCANALLNTTTNSPEPPSIPPAGPAPAGPVPAPPTQIDPADLLIPLGDSPVPLNPTQPQPADLGHIKISTTEFRRLHQLARDKAAGLLTAAAEAFHLHWSRRRRRHQANARWHHYRRHLAPTTG